MKNKAEDFISWLKQKLGTSDMTKINAYLDLLRTNPSGKKSLERIKNLFDMEVIKAQNGTKLAYLQRLNGQCPDGFEMVKFESGGKFCHKCMMKQTNDANKDVVTKFFKDMKKSGGKMRKGLDGLSTDASGDNSMGVSTQKRKNTISNIIINKEGGNTMAKLLKKSTDKVPVKKHYFGGVLDVFKCGGKVKKGLKGNEIKPVPTPMSSDGVSAPKIKKGLKGNEIKPVPTPMSSDGVSAPKVKSKAKGSKLMPKSKKCAFGGFINFNTGGAAPFTYQTDTSILYAKKGKKITKCQLSGALNPTLPVTNPLTANTQTTGATTLVTPPAGATQTTPVAGTAANMQTTQQNAYIPNLQQLLTSGNNAINFAQQLLANEAAKNQLNYAVTNAAIKALEPAATNITKGIGNAMSNLFKKKDEDETESEKLGGVLKNQLGKEILINKPKPQPKPKINNAEKLEHQRLIKKYQTNPKSLTPLEKKRLQELNNKYADDDPTQVKNGGTIKHYNGGRLLSKSNYTVPIKQRYF